MLKIRLQRHGRKNQPTFRLVLVDSRRAAKTGDFIEVLGSHDPRIDTTEIDADRVTHWIKEGAQPSDTVHNMLISEGIIEGTKRNVLPQKTPVVKEEEEGATEAIGSEGSTEGDSGEEASEEASESPQEKTEGEPEKPEQTEEEKPVEEEKSEESGEEVPAEDSSGEDEESAPSDAEEKKE